MPKLNQECHCLEGEFCYGGRACRPVGNSIQPTKSSSNCACQKRCVLNLFRLRSRRRLTLTTSTITILNVGADSINSFINHISNHIYLYLFQILCIHSSKRLFGDYFLINGDEYFHGRIDTMKLVSNGNVGFGNL